MEANNEDQRAAAMQHFANVAFTPSVRRHQERRGSLATYEGWVQQPAPELLGPDETEFLVQRDSVYLASIGEGGWPYVQHRGGPPGFIRVIDGRQLAWIERSGNRQFITAGNIDHDARVAMIAVDYPNRRRLKVVGHAHWQPDVDPADLAGFDVSGRVEGVLTIDVVAFDWNCPKFITPRFTAEQVRQITDDATAELQRRIAELETQLAGRSRQAHPVDDTVS